MSCSIYFCRVLVGLIVIVGTMSFGRVLSLLMVMIILFVTLQRGAHCARSRGAFEISATIVFSTLMLLQAL